MVRFILLFLGVIFYVFYSQIAGRYALNIHERLMYRLYFCWIRILLRVLSIVFRKFVSDKMKLRTGIPVMERLRSA